MEFLPAVYPSHTITLPMPNIQLIRKGFTGVSFSQFVQPKQELFPLKLLSHSRWFYCLAELAQLS